MDNFGAPSSESANSTAPTERPFERPGTGWVLQEGLVGGLVATGVMTLYRLPVFRALPPTAEFWAEYVQSGDPESFLPQALLLHLCYGASAGAVGSLCYALGVSETDFDRRWLGVAGGALYGGVLSVFGIQVMIGLLLDEELDREAELVFHVGHLVYGLSLGTWLSTRKEYGALYE